MFVLPLLMDFLIALLTRPPVRPSIGAISPVHQATAIQYHAKRRPLSPLPRHLLNTKSKISITREGTQKLGKSRTIRIACILFLLRIGPNQSTINPEIGGWRREKAVRVVPNPKKRTLFVLRPNLHPPPPFV